MPEQDNRPWKSGPPPSIGWWPASRVQYPDTVAWWNGRYWSEPVEYYLPADRAAAFAMIKGDYQRFFQWRDRPASWPKRSQTR